MNKQTIKLLIITTFLAIFLLGCSSKTKETDDMEIKENPIVTITMENDQTIEIELYPNIARNTVRNFISLINEKYYDGIIFHRVIPGFMIQGGDPTGTGMGGPDYSIKGEFSTNGFENDLSHEAGIISMARSGHPDSAGSQFFITVGDASFLDGEYAAFGKVIKGMETAEEIVNVETGANDKPLTDQKIKSITVDTKDIEYQEAEIIE